MYDIFNSMKCTSKFQKYFLIFFTTNSEQIKKIKKNYTFRFPTFFESTNSKIVQQ